MGVFLLIQIWSDFFIVLQKLCVWWWWWWRGGGGVLACHTALFTCWQWILPLISMQVAKESFFFFFFLSWEAKFQSSEICNIHHCARGFAVFTDFSIIMLSELILIIIQSICIKRNLIHLLSIHHSFQCAVQPFEIIEWTEMNAVAKPCTVVIILNPGSSSGPSK